MTEVIERALTCTIDSSNDELDSIKRQLESIGRVRLPKERDVFGIETASINKIKKARSEIASIEQSYEQLKELSGKYLRLSYEPLTWRNADGLPLLVPFSINEPRTVIAGVNHGGIAVRHAYDVYYYAEKSAHDMKVFREHYGDLRPMLVGPRGGEKCLAYEFSGLIPNDVRKKIHEALRIGLNCYIIAEPESHEIGRVRTIDPDPLAVAIDRGKRMWLIGDFDVTSVESMMVFHNPEEE